MGFSEKVDCGKVILTEPLVLSGRLIFILLSINDLWGCESVARDCCQVIHKPVLAETADPFHGSQLPHAGRTAEIA
jgi:hypothetical protein